MRDFIRPFRDLLNPLLVGLLPDEREERCVYSTITLFWTVVIGFIEHLRSRNQIVGFHEIGGFEVAVPVRRMSREHLR